MSYSLDEGRTKNNYRVLVFDLGGGTFDVSILKIDNGVYDVEIVDGDTHLGGEDFTFELVHYCVKQFHKDHPDFTGNVLDDPRSKSWLRDKCEKAK